MPPARPIRAAMTGSSSPAITVTSPGRRRFYDRRLPALQSLGAEIRWNRPGDEGRDGHGRCLPAKELDQGTYLPWRSSCCAESGILLAEDIINGFDQASRAIIGQTVVYRLAFASRHHEPLEAQAGELLAHRCLPGREQALEFGDRLLATRQVAEDEQSALVTDGLGEVRGDCHVLDHAVHFRIGQLIWFALR